ncbi:hypothetical protein DEU29_103151 [Idiomarina aquatica]|uniref:Uncharacterized protein n=1 Tax=Idiomarina aquatica TaxID=1327752 RepID=A0A4V3CPT2_9GAMM|nr:hypothetical protein DEU29_103151 [Idiomarina aquatica]
MTTDSNDRDRDRIYQVSTNRGRSSHKLRYVEASAPADGDCRMCIGSIADQPKARPVTSVQDDDESPRREDQ